MFKPRTCAVLLAAPLCFAACRKDGATRGGGSLPPVVIATELESNRMAGSPQPFLASRADSPVKWQHWEPEVLGRAKDARRLVFAFVGSGHYPGCIEALNAIDRDPYLVKRLNEEFVPVLVDVDSCRETGLLAGFLSPEIGMSVSFPFMLFLSPDGNEVTWRPVHFSRSSNLRDIFESAADVVARMWMESPDYVLGNSALDHQNRVKRLPARDAAPVDANERTGYLRAATRQLASQYDADIGTLSGTGGLFPLGILQCLASASLDPDTPPELAKRCREAVASFSAIVIRSAMVDPLDGGIYSARMGNSWDLPIPSRNCMTQARATRALVSLHVAVPDPLILQAALGSVRFAEERFSTPDGLFAPNRMPAPTPGSEWMWTVEQFNAPLTSDEGRLWRTLCAVDELGNLPSEADPERRYFRLNTLGYRMPPAEAAEKAGFTWEEAEKLLESGRKKLLKARETRVPDLRANPHAAASASFRMVSAYAALFTATGDPVWREKAVTLAEKARKAFSTGALLVEHVGGSSPATCDARTFTYALAIQAALDLAEISLDERWRIWAGDLATTVTERFIDSEGRLLEVHPDSVPSKLPIEDRAMLFDESTAGIMRMNLARLEALNQSPPPSIRPWITSLPAFGNVPVIFTDSILAASFGRSRVIIDLPDDASDEWKAAAARLPLDRISRRLSPVDEPRVRLNDGSTKTPATPEELRTLVLSATP